MAYCTLYLLGTLLSMQIRFVGFQAVQSSEHMAALGTFVVLQIWAAFHFLKHNLTSDRFAFFSKTIGFVAMVGSGAAVAAAYLSGAVTPWTGRFYSVLDPTHAKEHIPILASVAEHQPTTWASFFFDLHVLTILFPSGVYCCFQAVKEKQLQADGAMFVVIYLSLIHI